MLLSEVDGAEHPREKLGIAELDRVLGGGLVRGALVLVGGDPGIGKSTLLLQAMGQLCKHGKRVLYQSAEESAHQIKMRAERLGVSTDGFYLLTETSWDALERARLELRPDVIVVDSIQTVAASDLDGQVGSVAQIKAITHRLMEMAKSTGTSVFVVGHVTKDGNIAGPKVMEHMVDTVLYFEGERGGAFRILRAHKNRFGSAREIGVFEMSSTGLSPVKNPSELFLSQRGSGPGAAVVTSLEGSRPILLEVQALCTPCPYGNPRRTTLGFDPQRVAMLCAVLDSRAGLSLSARDIYVNIAGGVKISEPAADLGVALALASSVAGKALPADMVLIGEVGLSGEVRAVSRPKERVSEAAALGFSRALMPRSHLSVWEPGEAPCELIGVPDINAALTALGFSA